MAADVIRPGRPCGNECPDTAASLGWAGDERGQNADPPVHAVRARDVLKPDGLRALLGALRTCRNEGVVVAHIYPCIGILTHDLPALREPAVDYFLSFW